MVHIVKSAHRVKAWPNHQRLRSISLFINTRTSLIFIGIASKRMTEKSRRGRKSWFISMLKSSCMLYDLFLSGLFSVDCWMFIIGKSKDFVSSQDELSNNPYYYKLRPKLRETFNRNVNIIFINGAWGFLCRKLLIAWLRHIPHDFLSYNYSHNWMWKLYALNVCR